MRRGVWIALSAVALAVACGRGSQPRVPNPTLVPTPAPLPGVPADSAVKPDSVPVVLPSQPGATPATKPTAPAAPQRPGQRCLLDLENTPDSRFIRIRDPLSQKSTTYAGGGVVGVCRGQDMRIIGDSAESYEQNRLHYLIGHVIYREKKVVLNADRLTYYQSEERILAEGNVHVLMSDSSTMTGPKAEYFRAVRGIRPTARVIMPGRPTLRMYEKDSLGRKQADPVILNADQITGEGETLFVAAGNVQINRTDIAARGDSAVLDNVRQFSRLMKGPFVESKGTQPFTLTGRVIDIFGRTRKIERVLAIDSATAVNQGMTLSSDTLDLRVTENKLQNAYAFGSTRARAVTKERRIEADSLHVVMPNQRVQRLNALGSAYAETDADTSKVTSTERDWLRGDTIHAAFDSALTSDTASQPAIRELLASGGASSYYQIPSSRGEKDRPGVNYVRGQQIRVDFKAREVQTVTVSEDATGLFLEVVKDSATTAPPGTRGAANRGRAAPPRTPPPRRPPRSP